MNFEQLYLYKATVDFINESQNLNVPCLEQNRFVYSVNDDLFTAELATDSLITDIDFRKKVIDNFSNPFGEYADDKSFKSVDSKIECFVKDFDLAPLKAIQPTFSNVIQNVQFLNLPDTIFKEYKFDEDATFNVRALI